jgi:hypothetical protein
MDTEIWTGLARNIDEEAKRIIMVMGKLWKNGDQGASTAVVAAFDPMLNGMLIVSGRLVTQFIPRVLGRKYLRVVSAAGESFWSTKRYG